MISRKLKKRMTVVILYRDMAGELPEAAHYMTSEPPVINSGQSLEYRSGVDLCTDFGRISGFLYMVGDLPNRFVQARTRVQSLGKFVC